MKFRNIKNKISILLNALNIATLSIKSKNLIYIILKKMRKNITKYYFQISIFVKFL